MNQTNFKIRTNREIGTRIRAQREDKSMTQDQLGAALVNPINGAQIGSYETAEAPISADCLMEIAIALKVPVAYFFIGAQGRIGEHDYSIREAKFVYALREFDMWQKRAIMDFLQSWPPTGF